MNTHTSHRIGITTIWIVLVIWLLPILVDIAFARGLTGWVAYAPLSGRLALVPSIIAVVAMTKLILLVPLVIFVLWWLRSRLGRLVVGVTSVSLIVATYLLVHLDLLRFTGPPIDFAQRLRNALTFTLAFSNTWLASATVILMGIALLGILVLAVLPTPLRDRR
ncbi:hypothetical protein [Ferrimicrobium sp.]|uniref:hypothetical protein n=1 Tax=Ferrimicrobium sp. TaxID=2926050 RepID=UPI00260FC559|nr:hypothetical protein [Ferrimicrobium sp.]